ncbi:MAG: bifunctional hydroxymethylpyrimidine kinase/phosphomethylpyrimidine kinase [Firmicutes bacterium]|nr:bifunctional hydroxymethylpyrimidine kinase/phosphomethylpyrimidine kinase [Bacillota bacterium]
MFAALTIAGSDSGGGAGIQTDLKTFTALNVYGTSVITALTAQNTKGVQGIHTVPADFVSCQLESVLSDIPVQAAKTGMLGEADIIHAVAQQVKKFQLEKLVVDPVMVAESGDRLFKTEAVETLIKELLPLALIVTPNLPEASVLVGSKIETVPEMIAAAKKIISYGPRYVLIKGGHLNGEEMVDILHDGENIYRFSEKKLQTIHTHGSGCTYAAAIAANLAKGFSPIQAVKISKRFITNAILHGISVGGGYGPTNPIGALMAEVNSFRTAAALSEALTIIKKENACAELLVESNPRLFYCAEDTQSVKDISSQFISFEPKQHQRIKISAASEENSSLLANLLLEIHKKNPVLRAMVQVKYLPEIASKAATIKFKTQDHTTSLPDGPILLQLQRAGKAEPILLLCASTPQDAAEELVKLAKTFCRA